MLTKAIIYLTTVLLASVLAALRWNLLSKADRYIAALIWLTFLVECVTMCLALQGKNTQVIYHFYSPAEFSLLCLYFNECIKWFRRWYVGYVLGALGVLLALFNTIYFQHLWTIDSNFLLFEATITSICCVLSFYQMLGEEVHMPRRLAQCWISACYLLFWTLTFMSWGMKNVLSPDERALRHIVDLIVVGVNCFFYLGIAAVFFFYRKLIPSGD